MKHELLSIGEVARMKGVSHKSLRYYEQLGILTPAYIDPQTGYRYYAMNQMIDVDVIVTCIELDIPLKSLTDYMNPNGSLDLASLLARGRESAIEKLTKARTALAQIDGCLQEIECQTRLEAQPEPYRRTLADRAMMYIPWPEEQFNAKRYLSLTSKLYEEAPRRGIVPLYQWGMARTPLRDGGQWCVFVEIVPDAEAAAAISADEANAPRIAALPHGICQGWRIQKEGFEPCFHAVFGRARTLQGALMASEIWNAEVNPRDYTVELLEQLG